MNVFRTKKLILFFSLVFAAFSAMLFIGFNALPEGWSLFLKTVGIALLIFFISITLLGYLQKRVFHRRMINIYKLIARLRNVKEKRFDPNDDSELEEEIGRIMNEWSAESKEEIGHMKQVEVYRKEFLSNVSHELKTPIFSIQGYIHTLIDGGIDDQEINLHYLTKAAKGIDRLVSMVDDLESISRLESGELMVELRTFDVVDLCREVIESLELQANEKRVRLYINEKTTKPVYVYADKDMIRQVIVNLLTNSIKYGRKEGYTEISFDEMEDTVNVDISDNGIGIEKYHLPRLFERFYRVDKSRSREQGGTGLGLAIVKHIIEAHNENITVESTPGTGTTFSFTLRKSK